MHPANRALFRRLAGKYIWWKSPAQALHKPERIAAQVMNIGDYDDVQALVEATGKAFLQSVLRSAEIGQFNARSWHYWHYRLDLADLGQVPALPVRKLE